MAALEKLEYLASGSALETVPWCGFVHTSSSTPNDTLAPEVRVRCISGDLLILFLPLKFLFFKGSKADKS